MALLESVASFKARAFEIGMADTLVQRLTDAGIDTFGKLAYICRVCPTSGDDRPLKDALQQLVVDVDQLTPQEPILIRRLWFESYTLTVTQRFRIR